MSALKHTTTSRLTRRIARTAIVLPALLVIVGAAREVDGAGKPPRWYEESVIHTHHSIGAQGPEWDEQLDAVRPDAVQFHVLPGRAGRPARPDVTIPKEAIFAMKGLAEKHDAALVFTVSLSGQWRDVQSIVESLPAEEQKLFFKRVYPDGSSAGRYHLDHLCYYSPGIDRHIIPAYRQIIEGFEPRQIWIDHTVVSVNLCYCDHCKEHFRGEHGVAPPEASSDSHWDEWVAYHREGFEGWMKKVHDLDPAGTLMTFNHAYFIAQPEPPPSYVRNLSADIHSEPMVLCLFARYASTVGLPFDLMPGLTGKWAGKIPKTEEEVLQAAAVITANGGRWNLGEFPMSEGVQPVDEMLELAVAGANFIRERKDWTHRTEAVPLVAVLQTASTQYSRVIPQPRLEKEDVEGAEESTAAPKLSRQELEVLAGFSTLDTSVLDAADKPARSRLYWHNNRPIPHEILGAGAALLENNIPFDVINEATSKASLDEYKILIVGDQFRLDEATVAAIRRFVERGGSLLATGRTAESELAGLLGVQLLPGGSIATGNIKSEDAEIPVNGALRIRADPAAMTGSSSGGLGSPSLVWRTVGEGRTLYVAAGFFSGYLEHSPYTGRAGNAERNEAMREAVAGWIAEIAPDLGYTCSAPPWIEVALRKKGGKLLVQLVERTFEWRVDEGAAVAPIDLSLDLGKRPASVLLQPGDREVIWAWRDGAMHARIPVDAVNTHSIVEIK